jgi:GNAT superfamily N-acetyltransferase
MTWEVLPATAERFDDLTAVLNRSRRANHCWCLSPRLALGDIEQLGGGSREEAMRRLCERPIPPGVLAYRDGEPVGWCNVGPRADMSRLTRSRTVPTIDDVPVWSVVCLVVRTGHRRQGVTRVLLDGVVEHARSHGAPALEAYPVEPQARMDTAMAFVGTVAMFERAGFTKVVQTNAHSGGLVRWLMRRDLACR